MRDRLRRLAHRLSHLLGFNETKLVTEWSGPTRGGSGCWLHGRRCTTCGQTTWIRARG